MVEMEGEAVVCRIQNQLKEEKRKEKAKHVITALRRQKIKNLRLAGLQKIQRQEYGE